jgi:glycosyltransferase 2 family protein
MSDPKPRDPSPADPPVEARGGEGPPIASGPADDSPGHLEPLAIGMDVSPDLISEAIADDPLVEEDLAAGAVPITRRLRDRRTQASIIVPVLVLVLFAVALPGFKLDEMVDHILSADPWWLLLAFVIYYLGFPLRGMRWSILLRGIGAKVRVRDATEIIFVSWLVNSVVPAKLGDVYRAWLLKINFPVSLSATFGTIFIERVFDLVAIVVLGLGAAFWSFRDGLSDTIRIIMGIGVFVVVGLVVALFTLRNFGQRLVDRLPLPTRIVKLYVRFEEGVFSVDRRQLPIVGLLTGFIWTTEALRLLFVVEALGFDISLGISGAFFVALVASLLTAVPFTPAGLGIVEAGIVGLLTVIYQADPTEAAAIALVDRAISVLSVVILGFIAYLLSPKTKGRPREVRQAGPNVDRAEPGHGATGADSAGHRP